MQANSADTAVPRHTSFDAATLRTHEQYKLLTGTVIPRPIALVTTLGPHGVNAAPFSFFNAIGVKPPMVMLSIGPGEDSLKDTVRNLERLPEFVVHIVDHTSRHGMNLCAIPFPSAVSEVAHAGLRTEPSLKVAPPRLIDFPAQFECRVLEMRKIGRLPYTLVIGEVLQFHYREGIVDTAFNVDGQKLDPIGRLAGKMNYTRIDGRFSMPLPDMPSMPEVLHSK